MKLWWRMSSSLWFVPALMVFGAVVLAAVLVELETFNQVHLAALWPRLFGAGAEGARGLLSAVAGSMITVAGVVFSMTVVALSLASSQHSPRVLRAFMTDRPTQIVLGSFVGIFAYCLVVLRTIRGGSEETFVPSLTVLGGIVLAFVGIGFLIFFIHHLASSIEVSSILERVTQATLRSIENLFPEPLAAPAAEKLDADASGPRSWTPVACSVTGYIISVDNEALIAFARANDRVVRMQHGIGDFVIRGQTLAWLDGDPGASEAQEDALNVCYAFDRQRTTEQDAAFGVQQLVDVALKALSPGINDPTTAIMCIDRLSEVLVHVARRRVETPYRRDDGGLRVIAVGPSFAGLVEIAYSAVRDHARGDRQVLHRLLWSIEQVAAVATEPGRLRALENERARTEERLAAAA
jgi:uncharacterized membrane protein